MESITAATTFRFTRLALQSGHFPRYRGNNMRRLSMVLGCLLMLSMAIPAGLSGQAGAGPGGGQAGGGRGGGQGGGGVRSIADRTNGMQKIDGFFPMYWEES